MKRTLAQIVAIALGAGLAHADLHFKSKSNTYQAKASEESFETVFEFENTGKHPVVVTQVDSNCGCIRAEADKERYAPGEAGTVTAVFKIGSAEGTQSKSLTVTYAEEKPVVRPKVIKSGETGSPASESANNRVAPSGPRKRERLTVEVHIPTLILIEPKITKWPVGSPAERKTVEVTMNHENPILIREIRSSRENMKVELEELEKGKRYHVHLTPGATDKVQLGMLTIQTDCEIQRHQKKLAFFSIHRPSRIDAAAAAKAALAPRPNTGIVSPGGNAAKPGSEEKTGPGTGSKPRE